MAWDHLSVTKPHLVYILLGAFTTIFMLVSSFIKERMFIGEATVATIFGVIFGPHAANLINPLEWGNVDIVTLEFSRIVLVVQCFAIGVELPKFYMERHWKSVVYLLVPVMASGWLIVSLLVWWMVPRLNFLESLAVAACVTATDPVLASSVVGKGKFASRVPKHLRDLLSAESGCNDGMAFPFIYLAFYLILYNLDAKEVTFKWFCFTLLYECIFGAFYGFMVGYLARHGIKWAHEHDMIDRESFLVFYFVVALFCAGSGSILGLDDLLVGFAAGVGFSNDGWFGEKTEESHVSNVIDLLLNLTYFVYLGTIIPWEQFNNAEIGLSAWRLSVLAIFVILFRRIPIMMLLKPVIPDLKNWREALFAGHFGPIGVGAIFVALLARGELEHKDPVPMAELPPPGVPHYSLIVLIWPITTFLVISSMVVHGSSVAVFTLGKRITTLPLTISFTQAHEDGPMWMNRLPRISSMSRSQAKAMSDTEVEDLRMPELPPGAMPPLGLPHNFLRRQREEDGGGNGGSRPQSRASSLLARRRKKKWDDGIGPGGPVSQSAIIPARRSTTLPLEREKEPPQPRRNDTGVTLVPEPLDKEKDRERDPEKASPALTETGTPSPEDPGPSPTPPKALVYAEGQHIVIENEQGDVILTEENANQPDDDDDDEPRQRPIQQRQRSKSEGAEQFHWTLAGFRKKMGEVYAHELSKRKGKEHSERHREPARAYQFGNTIIVEDQDGEVVKTWDLPTTRPTAKPGHESHGTDMISQSLKMMGLGGFAPSRAAAAAAESSMPAQPQGNQPAESAKGESSTAGAKSNWAAAWAGGARKKADEEQEKEQDKQIRFKIAGVGQRMTKHDFIAEMQKLDARTRRDVVEQSNAPQVLKRLARASAEAEMRGGSGDGGDDDGDDGEPRRGRSTTVATAAAPVEIPGPLSSSSSPSSIPPSTTSDDSRVEPKDRDEIETPAERRRRMSVLAGQADDVAETPAERRRREAVLQGGQRDEDSDEDDEGTARVPPGGRAGDDVAPAARRGIRFADVPNRM